MVDLSIFCFIYLYFSDKIFYSETKRFDGVCFLFQRKFCFVSSRGHCGQGLKDMKPV